MTRARMIRTHLSLANLHSGGILHVDEEKHAAHAAEQGFLTISNHEYA